MNDFRMYQGVDLFSDRLIHYGKGHKDGGNSGRYPWGSGKRPNQRTGKEYIDEADPVYKRTFRKNSQHNRLHFDTDIKEGTTLQHLSRDKDRLTGADMFYAAYTPKDMAHFMTSFNDKYREPIYDENGELIGSAKVYKYKIDSVATSDIKVASEHSQENAFLSLYKSNRDFSNFVSDPERLSKILESNEIDYWSKQFGKKHPYAKAYRTLKSMLEDGHTPKESELRDVYKLFSYILPADGDGQKKVANDVKRQRAKLFKELKKEGYGALIDTNDIKYGNMEAEYPVCVFDMSAIIPKSVRRLKTKDKVLATLKYIGSGIVGMG